jgi:hypothetical protein
MVVPKTPVTTVAVSESNLMLGQIVRSATSPQGTSC